MSISAGTEVKLHYFPLICRQYLYNITSFSYSCVLHRGEQFHVFRQVNMHCNVGEN